jgi:hypothetical protein
VYNLYQWPHLYPGRATTTLEGDHSVQMNIEASIAAKVSAPPIAELVFSFGFRAGARVGFKLCRLGKLSGSGGYGWYSEMFLTIAGQAPAIDWAPFSFSCTAEMAFKIDAFAGLLAGVGGRHDHTYPGYDWTKSVGSTHHC